MPGSRTTTWRSRALVLLALAVLAVASVPLLRANAAARQRVWEADCLHDSGAVSTRPPEQHNPLIVQSGHTVYECRAADGHVVSVRD